MLCENCNKRMASVIFTQLINNQKIQMHLCEQCANEKNHLVLFNPVSVSELFSNILGIHSDSFSQKAHSCKNCGMTYEHFQKVGKVGCDHCYEVFEERIAPIIKRVHGNVEHVGKAPYIAKNLQKSDTENKELIELKAELENCIKQERYEQAAIIRDKINSISGK